jgi:hypothetical protein
MSSFTKVIKEGIKEAITPNFAKDDLMKKVSHKVKDFIKLDKRTYDDMTISTTSQWDVFSFSEKWIWRVLNEHFKNIGESLRSVFTSQQDQINDISKRITDVKEDIKKYNELISNLNESNKDNKDNSDSLANEKLLKIYSDFMSDVTKKVDDYQEKKQQFLPDCILKNPKNVLVNEIRILSRVDLSEIEIGVQVK